jgi:hypothetical protein
VVDVSGDHLGMRVSAYLTLTSADRPLEVTAWDDIGETDQWSVRISSADGDLILRADDPELIEAELERWAGIAREHRLAWEDAHGTGAWKVRNGQWEAIRRTAVRMVANVAAARAIHGVSPWTSRAAGLLAALTYAAYLEYAGEDARRRAVVQHVLARDGETALRTLEREAGDPEAAHACDVLTAVMRAAREERDALWSVVADALDAYAFTEGVAS